MRHVKMERDYKMRSGNRKEKKKKKEEEREERGIERKKKERAFQIQTQYKQATENEDRRARSQTSPTNDERKVSPKELLSDSSAMFPPMFLRLLARELVDRVQEVASP